MPDLVLVSSHMGECLSVTSEETNNRKLCCRVQRCNENILLYVIATSRYLGRVIACSRVYRIKTVCCNRNKLCLIQHTYICSGLHSSTATPFGGLSRPGMRQRPRCKHRRNKELSASSSPPVAGNIQHVPEHNHYAVQLHGTIRHGLQLSFWHRRLRLVEF